MIGGGQCPLCGDPVGCMRGPCDRCRQRLDKKVDQQPPVVKERVVKLTFNAEEEILGSLPWPRNCYIRVGVKGGGCSGFEYFMDTVEGEPKPTDLCFDTEDPWGPKYEFTVAVDPISAQYLRGTTIDFVETGLLKGFKFDNPNAKRQCGCGKSFSTT